MNDFPLLTAEGLAKHFVTPGLFNRRAITVRAVDDVSLRIERGDTVALVGESGSGKTTTAKLILRLIEPTAGRVLFNGEDAWALQGLALRRFRKEMQVIFQDPRASLNPRKTIFEILRDPLILHGLASKSQSRSMAARALEQVGLSPAHRYLDRNPREFSGGQLQRICVARAVSLQPKLIVADEPVSALDISVRAQILQLLQRLQQELGLAYLFITHDLAVVRSVARRVVVMYLGKIAESGSVEKIFFEPQHPYTRALLSATPLPNPRRARERERIVLRGEIPSPANTPSGCRFHTRCPFVMDICKTQEPELQRKEDEHLVACHLVN